MIDPAIIVDAIVLSGLAGIGAGAVVFAVSRRGPTIRYGEIDRRAEEARPQ
jgi:hypothetical protein